MEEKSSSDNNKIFYAMLCMCNVASYLFCVKERRKHIGMKKMSYKEQRDQMYVVHCV